MSRFDDVRGALAGRYNVESEIGEGGSAHVYAAHDVRHDRRVAIKVFKADVSGSLASDRFLREIRIDAGLQHPRILPLFDSGDVRGAPYFVMPFIEGETLRKRLTRTGPLPVREAVRITLQVADALAYLHGRRLVHRDVKPENILLGARDGEHVWLADFGIARALQDAIAENMTFTGTAIGTPAYMSPEQRLGAATIDGRSDQFSLALVLYEMLTGRPPSLFESARALTTPNGPRVTPARAQRSEIPRALDVVLARALRMDEQARWPDMRTFAAELSTAAGMTGAGLALAPSRRRPWLWAAAGAVAGGAALVLSAAISNRETSPPLDALKVAVLPLAHDGGGPMSPDAVLFLDGDDCSRFLDDAVGRWTGIHHVDDMELRDVRRRLGRPQTVGEAMRMARRLGAGYAIWGVVGPARPVGRGSASATSSADGATREIHVYLYDVAHARVAFEARGTLDPADDLEPLFQRLADSLLTGTAGTRPAMRIGGSRNLAAVRAYMDGHRALDAFDLVRAAAEFRQAIERDPKFGLAWLWLAWSSLWRMDSDASEWGPAAARALEIGTGLTARDSAHARALVRMSEGRHAEACDQFRTLLAADSRDFAAWYGLGECLSSDNVVLRDPRSKSGYAFRASMHESMTAYERAIALVPAIADAMGQRALVRLQRWLFVQAGRYRPGLGPDSARFASWPSLAGDTLAFIPFPERAVFADSVGTRDASYLAALQSNRSRLLAVLNAWVAQDSTSVTALEALALTREATDELLALRRAEGGPALTGVMALQSARRRATGDATWRLATTQVRFLLKLDRLVEARALADSLLRQLPPDSTDAVRAGYVHALAMLTGRTGLALTWGRRATDYQFHDPLFPEQSISPALSAAASDAATFASLGASPDSVRAALARVERALTGLTAPGVELARQLYVEQPLLFAWPTLGAATAPPTRPSAGNLWLPIQMAIARGDSATARAGIDRIERNVARDSPNGMAFELALLGTRTWLAIGDSARALQLAATTLDQVRTSGEQLLQRPTATASYVRLFIIRSALLAARGDTLQARDWATRAWTLWRDPDPLLQEAVRPIVRWRNTPNPGGSR